jgi:glutaminase
MSARLDWNKTDRVVPPVDAYLRGLHEKYAAVHAGAVATYIPELGKADPNWFGIALATTDGQVYEVGDTRQTFTIQSISKPFAYGLALEDEGLEGILVRAGAEPSGEAFNSISLEPGTGRPRNPMINAGAIATTSRIAGHTPEDKLQRMLAVFSLYAGHPLGLDEDVYRSEKETGHRNRAIGHMLRNFGILESDPEPSLDLYFRQCSIAVDCRDLSVIAACLANGGVNPLTGERALRQEYVQNVLSVMATCGMYDYAGEWVYWVGMPAKSGVSGGILAVLPGQLGIGVFSPRLDERGNSVRGVGVCRDLSRDFGLHFLAPPRSSRASIRAQFDLAEVSSKRLRTAVEREALDRLGGAAKVYGVGGDLGFSAAEVLIRRVVQAGGALKLAVVDLSRVSYVDASLTPLFVRLQMDLSAAWKHLVFVGLQRHGRFARALEEGLAMAEHAPPPRSFPDLDKALEWCEDRLLQEEKLGRVGDVTVALADHETCKGLTSEEIAILETQTECRSFAAGSLIIRRGAEADGFYLLMRGEVSVTIDLPSGQLKRFSTLSAGMAFGELAVVDRSPRSADVRADRDVECRAVPIAKFDALGQTHPRIKMTILENLLRNVSRMVNRLNQEVAALAL